MGSYAFGFDYGTLSCRGIAIDLKTGQVAAAAERQYAHGVINGKMYHADIPLQKEWNLQDPMDWLVCICEISREMLEKGNIRPEEVKSIGTDFTNCTLLPIKKDGTPLCLLKEFRDIPNAWPKLWKHHGAQKYAEEIETYAKEHTTWLKDYFGNSVSSEWVFPKMLQVLREDPEVYYAADYFMEAVDYIVMALTDKVTRCSATLGVNCFWVKDRGYPDRDFLKAIDPRLEDVVDTKLSGEILTVGDPAGYLSKEMADKMGLTTNVIVAAGHGDSAVAGCGAGVTENGSMTIVMGTSTCHQMMYKEYHSFDGLCSIAADGMVPGLYGYESGQPATGDLFQWFADTGVPERYYREAEEKKQSILQYLGELADKIEPGTTGLVALDWFNGNRSILSNYNLSGLIVGLTLQTRTEEIYRTLVEANIFGSRRILDNYEENGVPVSHIYAVGGIARKSPWIMQMCADVFGREVIVPLVDNVPAHGAAVCGAVALGKERRGEGFASFREATEVMIPKDRQVYTPDKEKRKAYAKVYESYKKLYDMFGKDDSFMKNLRNETKEE